MQIVDYISALPDSYRKDKDSNNCKLLSLEQKLVEALRDDIKLLDAVLDIKNATGKTLDLYGSIYSQARGGMTDEQYRYIILQKAAQCFVGGDYESVVKALANVFDVPVSDFVISESSTKCEVEIESLPYAVLQAAGITGQQAYEIIKAMLPAGVTLAPLNLEGTFEFASTADVYDENAGFGDVDQTVGGYFGYLENGSISVPK